MPIRYGAHSYLFIERWSSDQLGLLDTAKALGLDLWEIGVGDDVVFEAGPTRRRAEQLDIVLSIGPGGDWPTPCDLSAGSPEERALGLAWHQRQVDLASDLGAAAYTGALYGHPGTVKRRSPPPDEAFRTAEGLRDLAAYAARRGVKIVLEPMSHFRTHMVNTPRQLVDLIALADHDNLFGVLDTYHLVTEIRDYADAVRTVGPWLWGLHACESDRGVPGGGLVPWEAVFGALAEIHFDGCILMETYNSSIGVPPGGFALQRGMFHDPCPDGAEFVRRGLAFLKRGLAGR